MSRIGVISKINKNQEGVANSSNQWQYRLSGFQFLPMTDGSASSLNRYICAPSWRPILWCDFFFQGFSSNSKLCWDRIYGRLSLVEAELVLIMFVVNAAARSRTDKTQSEVYRGVKIACRSSRHIQWYSATNGTYFKETVFNLCPL